MMRAAVLVLTTALATSAYGQQNLTSDERSRLEGLGTVTTHATSTTRLPNTVADAAVAVEVTGRDVNTVATLLSQRSTALTQYLRGLGADRLTTGEVSFEPQNHTAKDGTQSIVGYTATTTVSFRTTPDKVGAALSGALANGANQVQSTNLHPREEEVDAARSSLAESATKRALAEAAAVTRAAGEHVLAIHDVTVDPPSTPFRSRAIPMFEMKAAAAPAPSIAISAGDAELSVSVTLSVTISK